MVGVRLTRCAVRAGLLSNETEEFNLDSSPTVGSSTLFGTGSFHGSRKRKRERERGEKERADRPYPTAARSFGSRRKVAATSWKVFSVLVEWNINLGRDKNSGRSGAARLWLLIEFYAPSSSSLPNRPYYKAGIHSPRLRSRRN